MSKTVGWRGLCVLLCSTFNWASAHITEVIVYPNGAQVKDERNVELKEGDNTLVWNDLSQSINTRSLRVTGPVRVMDFTFEKEHTPVEQNPERSRLEEKVRQAQERVDIVNDHVALINKKDAYLDQIQQSSTMPVKSEAAYAFPAPTQWEGLMDFLQTQRTALQKERRGVARELDDAQKELESDNEQLSELDNHPTSFTQQLTLKAHADRSERATLTLSYFDNNARWYPAYEVGVDSSTKTVQLSYIAYISQTTNNDWKDVNVTLSTAHPRFSAGVPELNPWRIREHEVEKQTLHAEAVNAMPTFADAAVAKSAKRGVMANSMAMPMMAPAPSTVQQGMAFAQFSLADKNSVTGNGELKRVLVADIPLKGNLVYKIVPELSTDAYLQAKVTNSSDYTLLHGDSQLYNDGNYVGNGHLPLVQPGEGFDLDLGIDPAIKIERKLISKKTEDSGLLQDNKKVIFSYSIELTNLKKSVQTVQLSERLPISEHEKIKIDLLEPKMDSNELAKRIDKEGKLTLDITLQPSQKLVLPLSYSVEFPKKMEVDGI